jgi:ABC-2 type transport system permease protein
VTALVGIIRKELKIAFTTPVAYVVFFMFTLLASLLFRNQLLAFERLVQKSRHIDDPELLGQLNFNDVILNEVFINIQIVFIFLIPILTMRSFAEERKQKTMELLMTTPITPVTVIVGKYLSNLVLLLCLCGTLLAGLMFSAAGFAFSSLTENQLVAALLTFFVLLLLWFLGGAAASVQGWAGEVLAYISPLNHIESFAKGILSVPDTIYYGSLAFLFLFFTYRMVEAQRWG